MRTDDAANRKAGVMVGGLLVLAGTALVFSNPVVMTYAIWSAGMYVVAGAYVLGTALTIASIHDDTRKVFNGGLQATLAELQTIPREVIERFLARI